MTQIAIFTFNAFSENTYVIYDETKECVIIDPGCYEPAEKEELANFISSNGLTPVRFLLTHAHIDHVLGNRFVADTYGLELEMHRGEIPVLNAAQQYGMMMGLSMETSPKAGQFLEEGDVIRFGNTALEVLFTPGHSPASVSFYCKAQNFVIAGDVLFQMSIGRTDLPGGNFETLIDSIKTKFFPLGDEVAIFPGHGPQTTVGFEKANNPFL